MVGWYDGMMVQDSTIRRFDIWTIRSIRPSHRGAEGQRGILGVLKWNTTHDSLLTTHYYSLLTRYSLTHTSLLHPQCHSSILNVTPPSSLPILNIFTPPHPHPSSLLLSSLFNHLRTQQPIVILQLYLFSISPNSPTRPSSLSLLPLPVPLHLPSLPLFPSPFHPCHLVG